MIVSPPEPPHIHAPPLSRMHCHATFRSRQSRVPSVSCGRFLGYVPGLLRFVGLGTRAPDEPDGYVWVRCPRSDCHAWNIFALVPPGEAP